MVNVQNLMLNSSLKNCIAVKKSGARQKAATMTWFSLPFKWLHILLSLILFFPLSCAVV